MTSSNDLSNEWQYHQSTLIKCRKCERLVTWREQVAQIKRRAYRSWEYWGKPVPGFGDPQARILVIGLAPGAHGSNRTGRMFTGDSSGVVGYLAAVTQSPLTSFVIVMEMIDGGGLVIPLMATALISARVSGLFTPPLYEALARQRYFEPPSTAAATAPRNG